MTKFDQLEIQLATTENPARSLGLAKLHAQTVEILENATTAVITEGQALLGSTVKGAAPGSEVRSHQYVCFACNFNYKVFNERIHARNDRDDLKLY